VFFVNYVFWLLATLTTTLLLDLKVWDFIVRHLLHIWYRTACAGNLQTKWLCPRFIYDGLLGNLVFCPPCSSKQYFGSLKRKERLLPKPSTNVKKRHHTNSINIVDLLSLIKYPGLCCINSCRYNQPYNFVCCLCTGLKYATNAAASFSRRRIWTR